MAINSAEELARYGYLSGAGFGESLANAFVGPSGYFPIVQKARDAYRSAQMEADRIGLESERISMLRDEYGARKAEQANAQEMNRLSAQAALDLGLPAPVRRLVEKAQETGEDWTKHGPTISMFGDVVARKNAEMRATGQPGPYEPGEPFASSGVKEKITKGDEQEEANAPHAKEYENLTGEKPTRELMRTADLATINKNITAEQAGHKAEELSEEDRKTYTQLAADENIPLPAGVNPKTYYLAAKANKTAEGSGKTLYVNLKDPSKLKSLTTDQAADPKSGLGKDWVTYAEWLARTRPEAAPTGAETTEADLKLTEHKEKLRASLRASHGAINAILAGRPVTDFGDLPPAVMAYMPQPGKELTPEQKDMAVRQLRMLQAQTARDLRNAPKKTPDENNNYPVQPFGDLVRPGPGGGIIGLTDPLAGDIDVPLRYGLTGDGQFTATMLGPDGPHTLYAGTVEELRKNALLFADQYPESGYVVVNVNPQTGRIYNAAQKLKPAPLQAGE